MRGPFLLGSTPDFPAVEQALDNGLLAVGGRLEPEWLLAAYRRGIFPWPWSDDSPVLWWCPDPRFVLYPHELRVSRSLEQRIRSGRFEVRLDTDFASIIRACAATPRKGEFGTWITDELEAGFVRLHELGFAHCAGSWRDGELAGGLYGVALGGAFFGESMFHREPDASKVAFATLVRQLAAWDFRLIDCQMETDHLRSFGARGIPRARFLDEIAAAQELPDRSSPWRPDGA
jgi:leucyl/phenylalanyl-tRNA--protein transferase